jgi:hypothetical protein
MELEKNKRSSVLKDIGPFAQAKTNLDKFIWNFMIFYTTAMTVQLWKTAEGKPEADAMLLESSAELTLRGVFDLVLDRDDGVWN